MERDYLLYYIWLNSKKDIIDKMDEQDPNANVNADMPAVPSNADEGPPSAEV